MTLQEKNSRQIKVINELFEELKRSKPSQNLIIGNFLYDKIREIFKIEAEYLDLKCYQINGDNDIGLKFVLSEENKHLQGDYKFDLDFDPKGNLEDVKMPELRINLLSSLHKKIFDDVPYKRILACKDILQTLFHEFRHFMQDMMARSGMSNKDSLRFAKEYIFAMMRYNIYDLNHDSFFFENDAEAFASERKLDLDAFDSFDPAMPGILHGNQAFNSMMVPGIGYVNRDRYVDSSFEKFAKWKNILYQRAFRLWPILLKEYNPDFTKRSLSNIISNYKKELKDLSELPLGPEDRRTLINDAKEMYYEIINGILSKNNRFELYEAVKDHGIDEIRAILSSLNQYNTREKKRIIDLIKIYEKSYKEVLTLENSIRNNKGYIVDPRSRNDELIPAIEYLNTIIPRIRGLDNNLYDFFYNKDFISIVPIHGYYMLKSGEKVSILEFLEDEVIPVLKQYDPSDYLEIYKRIVFNNTKPYSEVHALHNMEMANKDYQLKTNQINDYLDLPFLRSSTKNRFDSKYSRELIHAMEMVYKICEGDESVYKVFESPSNSKVDNGSYIAYTEEQMKLMNNLFEAALVLSRDEIFNPRLFNYYHKLCQNERIMKIKVAMKEYEKAYNSGIISR